MFSLTELPPSTWLLDTASDILVRLRKRLFVLEAWDLSPSDIERRDLLGATSDAIRAR